MLCINVFHFSPASCLSNDVRMSFAAQDSAWRHLLPTDAKFGDPVAKGLEFTILALALEPSLSPTYTNMVMSK